MHDEKPLKPADIAELFSQSLAWVSKHYRELGRAKIGGRMFFPPREVMYERLFCREERLTERYAKREVDIPWVFWHRYHSRKIGQIIIVLYQNRKKFMKTLCAKAGVPYFRFHPLRHAGASLMDAANIPISSVQKILGHECRKTTEI